MDQFQQNQQKSSDITTLQGPTLQSSDMKKRPKWFWFLIAGIIISGGFLALKIIGNIFISEVTQEINVKTENLQSMTNNDKTLYFELNNINGEKVKVTDYLGRPLVITFWATWNNLSLDQVKILNDYLKENGNDAYDFVTINSQEDESFVINFIKRTDYKINILLDENGLVTELYNARNFPVSYFIDSNGFIKDRYIGVMDEKILVDKISNLLKAN